MYSNYCFLVVFALFGSSVALTAEFIPKSFYVIHSDGIRSPREYFREKRSLLEPLFPLVRMRRSGTGDGSGHGAGSGSGSFSSSFASSGAGAGAGAGIPHDAIFFADNLASGLNAVAKLAGFPNGIPTGLSGVIPHAQGFGGSFGGSPGGCSNCGVSDQVPNLLRRFGGGTDGINYSGTAPGARGVYSSSSSSLGDDKVKYAAKAGVIPGGSGNVPNLFGRFGGDDGVSFTEDAQGAKGVYSASSSSIDSDGNVKYSVKSGKF